jgi:hypothetical protein
VGIPMGIVSAVRRAQWIDYGILLVSLIGVSAPVFLLGFLLIFCLSYLVPIFPTAGATTPLHLVLPAITLGLPNATLLYGIVDAGGMVQSTKSTPDKPIGTGPYVLKDWNRGENVVLERRANYCPGSSTRTRTRTSGCTRASGTDGASFRIRMAPRSCQCRRRCRPIPLICRQRTTGLPTI